MDPSSPPADNPLLPQQNLSVLLSLMLGGAWIAPALVYAVVFVATIPIWFIFHSKSHVIAANTLCSAVNTIFVQGYGYVWFTLAYLGHCFAFADLQDRVPTPIAIRQVLKYALYVFWGITFNFWFLGPLLVERLNVATGGHCEGEIKTANIGMHQCRASADYKWVDGFDLLGHYYFLLTLSLLLLDNIRNMPLSSSTEIQSDRIRKVLLLVRMLSVWLLTVWFLEYCITSIFFHTVGERMAGLVGIPVAYSVLYVDRLLWPSIEEREELA